MGPVYFCLKGDTRQHIFVVVVVVFILIIAVAKSEVTFLF